MKKLLKEPLLHFIAIGVVFFLVYGLVNTDVDEDRQILIDQSDVDEMAIKFESQWNRPATEIELGNLLQEKIRQEVFYQEALKLSLDHNDEMIKRRLSQKMQFLSNDLTEMVPPTQEELETYMEEHIQQYMKPAIYSLTHIYFSPETREQPRADAESQLSLLDGKPLEAADGMGDRFGLPKVYTMVNANEMARRMGTEFTNSLATLPLGQWSGPVRSGYGLHLVYLQERIEPQRPEFAEVEKDVRNDLSYQRQSEMQDAIFKEMVAQYQLSFDLDPKVYGAMVDSIKSGIEK